MATKNKRTRWTPSRPMEVPPEVTTYRYPLPSGAIAVIERQAFDRFVRLELEGSTVGYHDAGELIAILERIRDWLVVAGRMEDRAPDPCEGPAAARRRLEEKRLATRARGNIR